MLKTNEDLCRAIKLIRQFGDLFIDDEDNYGNTNLVKHGIYTGFAKPFRQKVRPLNKKLEEDLNAQLDKWLQKDIIEESTQQSHREGGIPPSKHRRILNKDGRVQHF